MIGQSIISGSAHGAILASDTGLSFWGGVDPVDGRVTDAYHPLYGQSVAGRVLVIPSSRGSCSGSGVIAHLATQGLAPAALVFAGPEDILTLGALVSGKLFDCPIPVVRLPPPLFEMVSKGREAVLDDGSLSVDGHVISLAGPATTDVALSDGDRAMLAGEYGAAVRTAMEILILMAAEQGATRLADVTQVHIDGCIYASPANLRFARTMADMGARVCVPTTTNAISVDHANWRKQGVDTAFGLPAQQLADAYVEMGATGSFTCAPYLLDTRPETGEIIGWSESNAVIYANSVLGARTTKTPDFLDLCIAITGRVPMGGVYETDARRPTRIIDVKLPAGANDALWPLLGYVTGLKCPSGIPLLRGLENAVLSTDDLKALCAAVGTTSSAPMLHIAGHTPEATLPPVPDAPTATIDMDDLADAWRTFNHNAGAIELVAFGSPHFSITECRALAELLDGRAVVDVIITLGRATLGQAKAEGILDAFTAFGIRVVPDLCWCSISEPVFPPHTKRLMTNSGKYAHYAPGLSGRAVSFGGLADCVAAARTGYVDNALPGWLAQ